MANQKYCEKHRTYYRLGECPVCFQEKIRNDTIGQKKFCPFTKTMCSDNCALYFDKGPNSPGCEIKYIGMLLNLMLRANDK